jgi:hypothetical protein
MPAGRAFRIGLVLLGLIASSALLRSNRLAAASLPSPQQFIGFQVGADNKLARWDTIVGYMKLVAAQSDRVRFHELGRTNGGNPFVLLEISSPDTMKNLDRYKQLERRLYFQGGAPGPADRDDIFRRGKAVVLVTCSVHATEIGATQMSLELVHRLATDDSPLIRKILDNVILLLVPSANPDGEVLVTDWFNKNLGTPYEGSVLPYLYHPYAGHDINRDMYMLTQKESQYIANVAWHDWLPSIWLDEHQMGSAGPRIFVMPAGDPINPNVHPLIYRWNGILGQSQAAALEAAGKNGIIYNAMYTNFWEGALAWSGWWHNQIGLLTEVANVPSSDVLPPPSDVTARTEYPRPWLGGRWTLRDIIDYDLIATTGLLEAAADRRETILRNIYEVNRETVESGRQGDATAIVIPLEGQHDQREAAHLVDRLELAGVEVYRSDAGFDAGGRRYSAGSFVIPMNQVFARYAKDLIEKQTYPLIPRAPGAAPDAPYDVTAWSLGMLLGVDADFLQVSLPHTVHLSRITGTGARRGTISGDGQTFGFEYAGPDTAIAINRLLKQGANVAFDGPSHVTAAGIDRDKLATIAEDFGLVATAIDPPVQAHSALRAPRIGVYAPWAGGNVDEGWTRWVLEQYEFNSRTLHNADLLAGDLHGAFDAIVLPDQPPSEMLNGDDASNVRPEYRGGIGVAGVDNLKRFVAAGGTLVALGASSDLLIDRFQLPVRDLKAGLSREQHSAPGAIVRIDVDASQPIGFGVANHAYGFYDNSPFFSMVDGSPPDKTVSVIVRYPSERVLASGWIKGEELMAGRAAVVSVEMNPGRIVLFGLRPQHRAQTHATFPLLFNALYLSTQ